MKKTSPRLAAAALLIVVANAACSTATARSSSSLPSPPITPYVQADVQFMAGMIPHHAQAIRMSALAPTRSNNQLVRVLAERIAVAQRDEIDLMQHWLRDRNEQVPDANATRHVMIHDGMRHEMLMPGMLTDEEFAQLERGRDTEFDRLFLRFMIRHHQGAVEMVDQLFKSYGAAQDETVFRFASDVFADQTTEIDRMQKLLADIPGGR